jgi:hypothetical protein
MNPPGIAKDLCHNFHPTLRKPVVTESPKAYDHIYSQQAHSHWPRLQHIQFIKVHELEGRETV